jgi:hypothetical protein
MNRLVLLPIIVAAAACATPRTALVVVPPPPHARAAELAGVPAFVLVPAVDARPRAERSGDSAEVGFIMASSGGAMSRHTGAGVLAGDDALAWTWSGAAADLGDALEGAAGRPVQVVATAPDEAAAAAPDGAVVVTLVIDHVAKITPQNHDFSQTKHQEGNYEITTTRTLTESFGPFWTFSFRVRLGEVQGGRIVRRLVRYAAASSTTESGYSDALAIAAAEVVDAVASEWVIDDEAVADGL